MVGLVVHEWVAPLGGSENVVDQFVKQFPDSDLQVLWCDAAGRFPVRTYETWLSRSPLRRSKALALLFEPITWRLVRARQPYDWMLVSSHLFAHHIHPRNLSASVPKFVYAHTPARYIWNPELDERGATPVARAVAASLKPLDRRRAKEASRVAANSEFTRDRVRDAWERDADVIYPPVDTERIVSGGEWAGHLNEADQELLQSLPSEYLLGASRFVPYKRLDLVVEAGVATGLPVVLAGSGPQAAGLHAVAQAAAVPVTFVDQPSDALLYALYQRAIAYVFPAIEDFGIMPVEAMAAGTPVVVPPQGGAAESVRRLKGGSILAEYSKAGWRTALEEATGIERSTLPERVQALSCSRFRAEIASWMSVGGEPEPQPARAQAWGNP